MLFPQDTLAEEIKGFSEHLKPYPCPKLTQGYG